LSFNLVRETYPNIAKFFQLLSFLNLDGICVDFLVASAKGLETDLRDIIEDDLNLSNVLLELEKLSLIKWNRSQQTVVIHRLVQAVIRDEMQAEDLIIFSNSIIDMCKAAFLANWNSPTRTVGHLYLGQVMTPLLRVESQRNAKLASVLATVAQFLYYEGKYTDYANVWAKFLQISENGGSGEDGQAIALTGMNNLAVAFSLQRKLTEAVKMYKEVLAKRKILLGEDHPNTLTSKDNLGWTYREQGKLTEAVKLHEEVLAKRKVVLGEDHPHILVSMHDLAATFYYQGNFSRSTSLFEEAYRKRKLVLGESHPHTLVIKSWLDFIAQSVSTETTLRRANLRRPITTTEIWSRLRIMPAGRHT
jgi:tetratricopeptide (TPR) repeat protein